MFGTIEFSEGRLRFKDYPFTPSMVSVFADEWVAHEDIRAVDLNATPPEVILKSGEILFAHPGYRERLRTFALNYRIPMQRRLDVWSLIAEPFLNVDHDDRWHAQTETILTETGITPSEVATLRSQVAPAIAALTDIGREVGMLDGMRVGLFGLLQAQRGVFAKLDHDPSAEEFEAFYWQAMDLAGQAQAAVVMS